MTAGAKAEIPRTTMLLDTASMYFRAFYGVPDTLRAPDGTPVNAVRGLLDAIAHLLAEYRPAGLVACWDDDWRPAWRVAAIPSYKAHRVAPPQAQASAPAGSPVGADAGADVEIVPEALRVQIPIIVGVLAALGIARVGAPGFEADDVIATLATRIVAAGAGSCPEANRGGGVPRVDIVTGDRDLFQLVDDVAGVRVLYPVKGFRGLEVIDQAALWARYGVSTGDAYADLATLRGDPSDGLPGVRGVGEKTAAAWLARFGDIAGILAARDRAHPALTPAQRAKLAGAREYLRVAPAVVRAVRDVPVGMVCDAVPTRAAQPRVLARLTQRWALGTSVTRVLDAMAAL